MIDWPSVFDEARPAPGASARKVAAFLRAVRAPLTDAERAEAVRHGHDPAGWAFPDRPLPESFASFLRYSDGGTFTTGRRHFSSMYGTGTRGMAVLYSLPLYMPGTLPITMNGGGTFTLFDLREPAVDGEYPILACHAGSLSFDPYYAPRVADGFPELCRGRFDVDRLRHGGIVLTADQWDAWPDPRPMLADCDDYPRALRRFACLCVRRAWVRLPPERVPTGAYVRALRTAERSADGLATAAQLKAAREAVKAFRDAPGRTAAHVAAECATETYHDSGAGNTSGVAARSEAGAGEGPAYDAARAAQADILREVVGNPLRPDSLPADWPARHPTVVAIARHVHDGRAYADLPVLADALEEAACPDESLVAHCRRPGGHHWGCWAVARLLGER